jgi:LysM repeat protein
LIEFITENFKELDNIQYKSGPPIEIKLKREVEHLKVRDREAKEDETPEYIFTYSRSKEKRGQTETKGRWANVKLISEYVTLNRGEAYYIGKIKEILPLLRNPDEGIRLRVFLGQIFSWYLVARADHGDGKDIRELVVTALRETVSRESNDHGFIEDIVSLMNTRSDTKSDTKIRELASRFRNNSYILDFGIYFGVDLTRALEGEEKVVYVLYALTYEIDDIERFTVYNRNPKDGEKLPIDYLGKRIDILDKEMHAFGFTWNGDLFGAVIKQAVKRYVYHDLMPILQDKPYLVRDDHIIHPLTYSISSAVKRDVGTDTESEILRKVARITALHELQHTVDELLGKIKEVYLTETSAYLASIALSECPYIALINVIGLYTNPWAGLFAPFHYRASVEIINRLMRKLNIEEQGDKLDIANAVLQKTLELKDGSLANLAREIHRDLFGKDALVKLERVTDEDIKEDRLEDTDSKEQHVPKLDKDRLQKPDKDKLKKSSASISDTALKVNKLFFIGALIIIPAIFIILSFIGQESPLSELPQKTAPPIEYSIKGDIVRPISSGDILTGIAEKYYDNADVDIANLIAEYNEISDPNDIPAGKDLVLPDKLIHIVKEGQSFGEIANMYYVSEEDLKRMNPGIQDYFNISPGDEIVVGARKSLTKDRTESIEEEIKQGDNEPGQSVDSLMQTLRNKDEEIDTRINAIDALQKMWVDGAIEPKQVEGALIEIVLNKDGDEHEKVRFHAIIELGYIASGETINLIEKIAAEDKDKNARFAAKLALEIIENRNKKKQDKNKQYPRPSPGVSLLNRAINYTAFQETSSSL